MERQPDDWEPPSRGALDDTPWPEQLLARAVEVTSDDDRVHGYAVIGDLAMHYRYSDFLYLSITGDVPEDAAVSALFELALFSASTLSVADAPVHVSVLARLSGAPMASSGAAGAIVAADRARDTVAQHRALLDWLAAPTPELPMGCQGTNEAWLNTLIAATEARGVSKERNLLRPHMTRDAARIALFYMAGLREPTQLEVALWISSFGALTAESLATGPQHLSLYPVNLPPFWYVEDDC